ncbi:phage tail assembly protein [Hyalangium gracile]|uniref:phage tail assembly protein n=1 Tax=Hyalangium gracile TaxID=394092 RepID=UPI001CCF683C|nr:phage tail assembly protein [Hyalangium gracile]
MTATTEFPFTLPFGFRDETGTVHREGTMRLSTALDEIAPLKDPRVQSNPGYLVIILLARVITRLGSLEFINPKTIENLLSGDLLYLQDFYRRINESGHARLRVACPHCQGEFEVEASPVGES